MSAERCECAAWRMAAPKGRNIPAQGMNSQLDARIAYIDGQEEHHRKRTFKEEFAEFLQRYGVDYDERYVWD